MSQLDRLVNIQSTMQDEDHAKTIGKTSVAKVVLLFYLISANSYNKNLFGKQMQRFIEDNRLAQHVIAFITLFVLISFESDIFGSSPDLSTLDALIYTIIGYIWFVFSTKLDVHWNIIFLILLVGAYISDRNMRVQEDEAHKDPSLTTEQVRAIIEQNNAWRTLSTALIIVITIIGTVLYSDRKSEQYGGGYDIFTYMLY